jgi:hypothetical protein
MFDANFTFDTPLSPTLTSSTSESTSETRDTSRSVSPCSSAFPPARFSVTDLASQFADSRIRNDSRIFSDPCEAYANMDDDADWSIPSIEEADVAAEPLSRSKTFPSARGYSPSRRIRRQENTRLLCSTSHRRELAALVSRMVERNEQCSITPPETEDEGYNSAGDMSISKSRRSSVAMAKMSMRRNGDVRGSGCCVSKDVRFRKGSERGHKKARSSDKA